MWWGKSSKAKESEFYKGLSLFEQMARSAYARIKQLLINHFGSKILSEYRLPRVVVIGNESTGKSSLIENITKCQIFPRATGICTRCPIHLRLESGSPEFRVTWKGETTSLASKDLIIDRVSRIMSSIPEDQIAKEPIEVLIQDNDVPNFEFFDLPGIRSYPPELATMTTELTEEYLSDKNSIVVCVVPATQTRLTSCQSIALVSKTKMEGNCILALTMIDRLQPENIEDLLVKRVIGTSDELKDLKLAGTVAIVNRIHNDAVSLQEQDGIESKWFEDNILGDVPPAYKKHEKKMRDSVSIKNLLVQMDQLYNRFMEQDWKPRILGQINERILALEAEYQELGSTVIDAGEANKVLVAFLNELFQKFESRETPALATPPDGLDPYQLFHFKRSRTVNRFASKPLTGQHLEEIVSDVQKRFAEDSQLKLRRFASVQEGLTQLIQQEFARMEPIYEQINEKVSHSLEQSFLQGKIAEARPEQKFQRLYLLLILHPILRETKIPFKDADYVESDEYRAGRIELQERIRSAKSDREALEKMDLSRHGQTTDSNVTPKKKASR